MSLMPDPRRPEPFLWGRGGRRMSRDDIDLQRRLAAQQMQAGTDYSPVASPWQGMARVANGLSGAFQMRRADKAAGERAENQQQSIEALLAYDPASGGDDPIAALLADPELRDIGIAEMKARQPKAVEPVIQRANNGDIIGLNPMTGEVVFQREDPNPKPQIDWITARNPDNTMTLIPVGPSGPIMQGGGGPASGAAPGAQPPATLPPDFDFGNDGGPTPTASGGFRPSGAGR